MILFLRTLLGVGAGLGAGLCVAAYVGESPWKVFKVLMGSSFGSAYSLGTTLLYAVPLLLTGMAVAIPFRAGLFNIGAEGQLTIGALTAASVAILFPDLPPFFAVLTALVAAALGGGLWGGFVGWLKATRGSHEVITSIMMNFIAAALASYVALYWIKDPSSAAAESVSISESYRLIPWTLFEGASMGLALPICLAIALILHFVLERSVFGFRLKAVGENENAAQYHGISRERVWIESMFLSGALAGLVALPEVLGNAYKFKLGFSPGYGFVGIAVALVARGKIIHILWSSLLFAVLQKGSASLDLETEHLNRDIVYWIQALIILGVSAEVLWSRIFQWRRERNRRKARST
jgi:general nucleoside transport system permease protein